jgi:hypothetical protein
MVEGYEKPNVNVEGVMSNDVLLGHPTQLIAYACLANIR